MTGEQGEQTVEEDLPLPEDEAIRTAHPSRTRQFDRYNEALRLVGAKRSKYALVDLVNWLLSERDQARETTRELHRRVQKIEGDASRDWNLIYANRGLQNENSALKEKCADHDELLRLIRWIEDDWAQVYACGGEVVVVRLEEGQGAQRIFMAPTLREAVQAAMSAPPGAGEEPGLYEDERHQLLARLASECESLSEDALRWRKLIGSARVRVIGSARLGDPSALIGMEFFGEYPWPNEEELARQNAAGQKALLTYIDGLAGPTSAAIQIAVDAQKDQQSGPDDWGNL